MTLAQHLAKYGEYHRDHRNVLTHALGIPMIVLAVMVLLSRPVFDVPLLGVALTPAMIGSAFAAFWYIQVDFKFGLLMTVLLAMFVSLGKFIAGISVMAWLGGGIALFVAGWALQFLGHYYEGRKPAFVDDLRGLLVGPMFVTAEALFALGLASGLEREVKVEA